MEEILAAVGFAKSILEKRSESLIKGIISIGKDEWEKFKIDFDISFKEYLKNSVEKYGKIKTILYRTQPKYLYDFFECPYLQKNHEEKINGNSVNDILDISNFIIIEGTGGIGKSTFLKHLFLDEVKKKDLVPVFIELKDLNSIEGEYDITEFIFKRLYSLGSTIKKEYMEYALQAGCFMFLLDGYDEIATQKRDIFFGKLDAFCDRYSKNYFIISSRPYSEFVEFQRFTVLSMCNLSKEQAISLINKIEFDADVKQHFIEALQSHLYSKHKSFASNPLLLNIMLLTFDNYAEIPEKLHLFYSNAFETLYSKHDATKSGYRRELKCSLPYDSFKKVFSCFCFITYYHGQIEFSYDELISVLTKISKTIEKFNPTDFLYDIVNSICVLHKDGIKYKFTHRSFQEYFTAVFLKELTDDDMKKTGIALIKKDGFRASRDSVFFMLSDMAKQRYEHNILLPLIEEFEGSFTNGNKVDFYFKKMHPDIGFRYRANNDDVPSLIWIHPFSTNETNEDYFIAEAARQIFLKAPRDHEKFHEIDKKIFELVKIKFEFYIDMEIPFETYSADEELYLLLKESWIGEEIKNSAQLREQLEKNKKESILDISSLLSLDD